MSPVFNQSRRELRYVIGRAVGFESASPKGFGAVRAYFLGVFSKIVNVQQGSYSLTSVFIAVVLKQEQRLNYGP